MLRFKTIYTPPCYSGNYNNLDGSAVEWTTFATFDNQIYSVISFHPWISINGQVGLK